MTTDYSQSKIYKLVPLLSHEPHDIYIGTNYNFDEIWYGATRFITKCSWGPYYYDIRKRRCGGGIPWPSSSSSSSLVANKSSYTINVEKEMNTFDRYDTTSRIQLVQQIHLLLL